jgi:predicted DNA-binding transcriptional regulator YafY
MRVYRVSRFVSARVLERPFQRPEGFELDDFWEEWSRTFEESTRRFSVKLRASELVRRFLPRELQPEDGVYTVRFDSLDDAFRELLKFGPDAEVLDPPELRDRIASAAAQIADLYGVRAVR